MADTYKTYVFNKDDFIVPDIKDIRINASADLESMTYLIKAKCGMETSFGRILELIRAGMNITVTFEDGSKHAVKLEDVKE